MAMTRKDFQAIADQLEFSKPAPDSPDFDQWWRDVQVVANALNQINSRFNRDRFYDACGVPLAVRR